MTQNPNRSAYRVIFDGSLGEHFWITVLCFAFIFRTWDQYKYKYIYNIYIFYIHVLYVCARHVQKMSLNIILLSSCNVILKTLTEL
jgi:hypothetical protein